MEELQAEMAAAATTTTTTTTIANNNSDSDASPGRSSPASQQSEPGSRAAPDVAAARSDAQASATASSRRRRAADWEIMQGLRTGQRCDDKPKKFEGYLLKRRKWPLKGWHKRFFCLEKGILTYAKSSTDMAKGKNHGSVDLGLSVISTKGKGRRIDIDAEEFIYHLKVKNQAQFQQWVSQLQHHRLYRQHEITFGSREAPKMTSPAAEDSGGIPGGNGPSGALTICKCPLTDSTCHHHHCYRELLLSARTCTQACITGPLLGSPGFNTCKCSEVAAKESAASENPQLNAVVSSDVPSMSTNDRELVSLTKKIGEDVRRVEINSLAEAAPRESKEVVLAVDAGKGASQKPVDVHDGTEPKIGAGASDGISAGRGATTCGIDTDTFVVTLHPGLGSNYTNSLTCDTSSEEMLPGLVLDERTYTVAANEVDASNLQNSESPVRERETPTIRSNSLITRCNRNFYGLQTLRQGTNIGVNTVTNGETVETEHNTRVNIIEPTHPRMITRGRKNQTAPTPQVIVGTVSTEKSASAHPERVDQQETLKQHNSSGPCLIDSGRETEPKIGAEASEGICAGRGATTCGIDTDAFLVTFHPGLGSNYTNSLTCDTSSEEMPPVHVLDEHTYTVASVVDASSLQNSESPVGEQETPTIQSNSLVTCRNRNFYGLQTLRQGTNVGVDTDPNSGETVETEYNTRVKIIGHTHPRLITRERKNQSAPTPRVIVGTVSTEKSASTHPERVDQPETLRQHNSSEPCLIDSGYERLHSPEPGPEHLNLHSVSPQGSSSNVKARNLADCELPYPTSRLPDIIMPPSHSGNDLKYIDSPQAVPDLSLRTVYDSDQTAEDLSSFERWGLHEPAQSMTWPCSDGSTGRLNKEPSPKQAELGGIDWLWPSVESSDDIIKDVPVRAVTDVAHPAGPDGVAGQISGLSHSGIGAQSHQSSLSSAQYCTALPEQTGSEFRDTLQTCLFLNSDSSSFANLQHSPS